MKEIVLKVKKRETGKKVSKLVRREGMVPGVFYSKGVENINVLATPLALRPIVYTSLTKVINLEVEGSNETHNCVLKAVTFDPVTDRITHFDLQGIQPGQKLNVEIQFKLKGQALGVKLGGKLMQVLHKVKVKCLPKDLVEYIEVDIAHLDMGQSVQLKDVNLENLECDLSGETVIVQVNKPRGGTASS